MLSFRVNKTKNSVPIKEKIERHKSVLQRGIWKISLYQAIKAKVKVVEIFIASDRYLRFIEIDVVR